jgi:hypothetical protein
MSTVDLNLGRDGSCDQDDGSVGHDQRIVHK